MATVALCVNTVSAENINNALKSQPWMVKMKSSGKHSLSEFKGGFQYLNGKKSLAYSVQGSTFKLSSGNRSSVFTISRDGSGYVVKNRRGAIAFWLKKAPAGYAEFTRVRSEKDPEKKLTLAKSLAKKGLDPFVSANLAKVLFDGNTYSEALVLYQKIGDKTGIAACNIMQTAQTGKVPAGANILASAKVFWEHNASKHPSLREFYHRAEAVAYACAVSGNLTKAQEYQKALYQQAQRYQVTKASAMRKAGISVPKLVQVLHQYQSGKYPSNFRMSAI